MYLQRHKGKYRRKPLSGKHALKVFVHLTALAPDSPYEGSKSEKFLDAMTNHKACLLYQQGKENLKPGK